MANKKDVTVYIGRFNPFHLGHAHILGHALSTSVLTIVLVGSTGLSRRLKNPFNFNERKQMIEAWAAEQPGCGDLIVLPVRDRRSNNMWIQNVQGDVKQAITRYCHQRNLDGRPTLLTDVTLTGSDRDSSTWYLKSFPQWNLELIPPMVRGDEGGDLSATSVRKVLYESALEQKDFDSLLNKVPKTTATILQNFASANGLDGLRDEHRMIAAYKKSWEPAPYDPTFLTADAVVIQSGHVLVIERASQPGKGLWAFPGGFVKKKQHIKEAAIDECVEETGIRLTTGKKAEEITKDILRSSIVDFEIFDDPERSARGRTVTTAYLIRLDDSKPLPKVHGMNIPADEDGTHWDGTALVSSKGANVAETAKAFWLPLWYAHETSYMWFEDHHLILEWAIQAQK